MTTDLAFKNVTCPADKKKVRLADSGGGGLFLEVTPNGAKRWFWRYTVSGKERVMSIGSYCRPGVKKVEMSAKEARAARDAARLGLNSGVDPLQQRQLDRAQVVERNADNFEAVAREFHALKASGWSAGYARKWLSLTTRYLFPWIGTLPIGAITVPLLLATLRRAEAKGVYSTVQDLRESASQVFTFAMQAGRCERNPAAHLAGALAQHIVAHHAALVDPVQVGGLLRAIDGYDGQPATRGALQISALLFQRPGNIRAMEWAWLDLPSALLTIPPQDMKRTKAAKLNGDPHLVPLAVQAVAVLEAMRPLSGHGRYVFPSLLGGARPMSDNTLNNALRRLGYSGKEMTAHGFRAMARTVMKDYLDDIDPEAVEDQLAHGKEDTLGRAYNRSENMRKRKLMMQTWADYLDTLRAGAQIIPIKAA